MGIREWVDKTSVLYTRRIYDFMHSRIDNDYDKFTLKCIIKADKVVDDAKITKRVVSVVEPRRLPSSSFNRENF